MSKSNYNPPYGYQAPQGGAGSQGFYGGYPPQYGAQQQVPPAVPFSPPQGGGSNATGPNVPGMLPPEQSYIENILRLNKGKLVTLHATFENNREWNAKIFKGIIEAAGRDHVILSDPQTGERNLIPMVYVDYITFSEEIDYEYPFGAAPNLSTYSPR
ncbi:spore coat protein GerQ [Heyndrickxia sporothermodurans]|uniref:spore coat protein GerQ n=1 Tax=Heyndrickxia sporothermodurans TaxID=46224 RepID=UPI000D3F84B6|nr:spore coat protein GerQ [Heyndrickxia sporothermodurans]PTY78108.1 spore coat protein GerQ [Heyndrickxia sporothermodurans]